MDGIVIALNREVLHTVNLEAQLAEANERIAQLADENQVLLNSLAGHGDASLAQEPHDHP